MQKVEIVGVHFNVPPAHNASYIQKIINTLSPKKYESDIPVIRIDNSIKLAELASNTPLVESLIAYKALTVAMAKLSSVKPNRSDLTFLTDITAECLKDMGISQEIRIAIKEAFL